MADFETLDDIHAHNITSDSIVVIKKNSQTKSDTQT